jgi:hypothetical protein
MLIIEQDCNASQSAAMSRPVCYARWSRLRSCRAGLPGVEVGVLAIILGQFVLQLDAILDDGKLATGSMRAIQTSAVGGAPSTTATVEANPNDSFIVCLGV